MSEHLLMSLPSISSSKKWLSPVIYLRIMKNVHREYECMLCVTLVG